MCCKYLRPLKGFRFLVHILRRRGLIGEVSKYWSIFEILVHILVHIYEGGDQGEVSNGAGADPPVVPPVWTGDMVYTCSGTWWTPKR